MAKNKKHGAFDVEVVIPHSLTHLLDTTISDQGRVRLHSWLLNQPPSPEQWRSRQALVRELTSRPLLRDRLTLDAKLTGDQEINGKRLAAVIEHRLGLPHLNSILVIQGLLALTTIGLGPPRCSDCSLATGCFRSPPMC